jgi:hypothetical protein
MKEAIIAKRIDLWLQALALLIPVVWAIAAKEMYILFAAYFSVGGVQVLSCILNKIGWNPNLKHNGRTRYEQLLLVIGVVMPLAYVALRTTDNGLLGIPAIFLLGSLLVVSPFMAIWYLSITREELLLVRRLSQRRVI